MSIKARNILLAIVVMVGLGAIHMTAKIFNDTEKELLDLRFNVAQVNEHVLELRKNEKDFFARNDTKYETAFQENTKKIKLHIDQILRDGDALGISTQEFKQLSGIVDNYAKVFVEIVAQKKNLGLTPEEGLEGKLRKAVHAAETLFKEVKNYEMQTLMLTLRRNEKDFMLRSSLKYLDDHTRNYQKTVTYITAHEELVPSLKLMEEYRNSFVEYVKAQEVVGLDEKSGLNGKLRSTIHQTEEVIEKAIKNMDTQINEHIAHGVLVYFGVGGLVVFGVITLILLIIRSVLVPLRTLTNAIVSNERDLTMRYQVPYNDELKEISNALNDFMERLRTIVVGAINASDENAAVAHELSSTSNNIGKRAEEESLIVAQTTQTGNSAKEQIDDSVASSKEAKKEIEETNASLLDGNHSAPPPPQAKTVDLQEHS
jgi:methyl-accepting chemotaxis protein